MGTFTSQILIGQKHTYDSGIINISHTMYLSENSRPAWTISATDLFNEGNSMERITWIPTLEHMLEDALVMIGLYVLEDKRLISLANQYFKNSNKDFIELYRDIEPDNLEELYNRTRQIQSSHKIILTVFQGSSIRHQLPVLERYPNDIEVCKSIYIKELSPWSQKSVEMGDLE